MVFLKEKIVKRIIYIYTEKSVRVGKKIIKVSKFLGRKDKLSKSEINIMVKNFLLEIDNKIIDEKIKLLKKSINKYEYPLTINEIKKIEYMNLCYHEILNNLHKKDIEDLRKRFIANFVFESNAIEGNSLTLKNYQEIIFEKRISRGADLREVYDAKNSYETFSWLSSIRKPLSADLIKDIHKRVMKNIDTRLDYRNLPSYIIGSKTRLCSPEKIKREMEELILWYNKNTMYPLELALKFHHKFEKIHPFADGNGRVGRMLLNYILLHLGYFPIIIRNNQRQKYIKALQSADLNKYLPLMRFGLERAKITYRKFFEVYYKYTKIKVNK